MVTVLIVLAIISVIIHVGTELQSSCSQGLSRQDPGTLRQSCCEHEVKKPSTTQGQSPSPSPPGPVGAIRISTQAGLMSTFSSHPYASCEQHGIHHVQLWGWPTCTGFSGIPIDGSQKAQRGSPQEAVLAVVAK
eukprot:4348723-Amphidinium_carterae.1